MCASLLQRSKAAAQGRYRAHGVELVSDFPLPLPPAALDETAFRAALTATSRPREDVLAGWSGGDAVRVQKTILSDGKPLLVEQGRGGDHLISYGEHLFHLSADVRTLACTRPQPPDAGWQRVLLEWVAYAASILSGLEQLHASAVQVEGGVIAIAAPAGTGKTTLAAELASRGARYFCDDVLSLGLERGEVVAYPGPPFVTLGGDRGALAERLGSVVAGFGDELWLRLEESATRPSPVAAVVLLERKPDAPRPPRMTRDRSGFFSIRKFAVGFPHLGGRERQRFDIAAALAEQAVVVNLSAASEVGVDELRESLQEWLHGEGVL